MDRRDQRMVPRQLASLLDSALRTEDPLSYLDAVVMMFKVIGRYGDSVTAAWIGCLYAEGEIDMLISLRAAWLRGEEACPAEAAHRATEWNRFSGHGFPSQAEDRDWG